MRLGTCLPKQGIAPGFPKDNAEPICEVEGDLSDAFYPLFVEASRITSP